MTRTDFGHSRKRSVQHRAQLQLHPALRSCHTPVVYWPSSATHP